MPPRTLAATTLILLLASTAPPPILAAEVSLSRPTTIFQRVPGEIWSALRNFVAFLGLTINPDGTQSPDSGHGMDPDGRDGSDSGHGMDPNG